MSVVTSRGSAGSIGHMSLPATAPNRRERRVQETREAIVQAARELFESQGYAETTLDQVAARADVASRTVFRYFASKEALLFCDFERVNRTLAELLAARPAGEAPMRGVIVALSALGEEIERDHDRLTWAFRVADQNE